MQHQAQGHGLCAGLVLKKDSGQEAGHGTEIRIAPLGQHLPVGRGTLQGQGRGLVRMALPEAFPELPEHSLGMVREGTLQGLGDLRVLELPFTHELAALSPEEFVRQHLLPLRLKHLVIGHDFTLGRGRSGQPDVLRALGEKYGFDVDQLPPVEVGGHVVSSTCLRELIGKGDVATAASLLGHAYGCEGLVVHGEGRGTGLGFPTANIAIPDTMLPAPGVYATRVVVPHLGRTLQAVTNIGRKPTFGDYGLSIESFLLDTDLNLYGNELRLDFVARLRDEKRFESADALVAQIRTDVARARDLLTMYF